MRRYVPLLLIVLAACQASTVTPDMATTVAPSVTRIVEITATVAPTETPTATNTSPPTDSPTPTSTPTLAISLTPTPILPTPALPMSSASEFRFAEFFFDNSPYPDCELPCWKGLVIGESTSENVQRLFDTEFGFNGMLNFRTDSNFGPDGRLILGLDEIGASNRYPMGYHWINYSDGSFYVVAIMNQDTDLLEGIFFSWSVFRTSTIQIKMTPRDLLQQLGTPSEMLATWGISEVVDVGSFNLLMIYDQGVIYRLTSSIPTGFVNGEFEGRVCLGKSVLEAPRQPIAVATLYVIDPSPQSENYVSHLAQSDLDRMIENRGLVPLEQVFGITPEEAAEMAQQGGDMCFTLK